MQPISETLYSLQPKDMARAAERMELTAFPEIVRDFHRMEEERWMSEGPGWPELAPSTVAHKTRKNMPNPSAILVGEGKLRDSLTSSHAEGSVVEILPDELTVGTSLPYALPHQMGGRISVWGRGTADLPQRILVNVTEVEAERWGAMVQAALRRRHV